jgi:hypothetical protein
MMREKRQLDDASFVLFPPGEPIALPYNATVPGSVRYRNKQTGEVTGTLPFPVDEQFRTTPNQARHAPFPPL